ncbi:hypothetical protein EYF80_024269 [Liparis tanakae]|uniref:Uncharacterized protein n=1 Tax=Liparis tanakae TaxID=230148 RepID=A0A4Z2HIT2_9TELE|nr:hypothetical protein EYF80_024269 [Liparis tanakae]
MAAALDPPSLPGAASTVEERGSGSTTRPQLDLKASGITHEARSLQRSLVELLSGLLRVPVALEERVRS